MVEEITTPEAPRHALPLPQGVRAGDYVFTSGQIAVRPDGTVVTGDFDAEVRCVLDNVKAIITASGGTLHDVCKVTAFITNATLFDQFNSIYTEYFGDRLPARSTLVVSISNPDLRIEVDAMAYLPR
jgi:2-iminobutanoate/2-iminopropanoate deaminase